MTSARVTFLFSLGLGVLVAVLGFRQLAAALAAAPGNPVIATLHDGQPATDLALNRLLESRRSALGWQRSPDYYRDVARATRILAQRAGDDRSAAISAFEFAADATEDGLRLAPVDPASWLRLATIRLNVDADPEASLTALRAAVLAAPYDPRRTKIRVRLVLRLWPLLDAPDRVLMQPLFRQLWADDPGALTRLALDERNFLIALAMLDDTESAEMLKERRHELFQSRQ